MFLLNPSLQGSESYTEESVERLYESEVMDDSKEKTSSPTRTYIHMSSQHLWQHKDDLYKFIPDKKLTWTMVNKTKMPSPLQGAIFFQRSDTTYMNSILGQDSS